MYLTAVVKGERYQVARAAAERGIQVAFVREVRVPFAQHTLVETVIRADVSQHMALLAWFGERPPLSPFVGYPIGTLLIISEHREASDLPPGTPDVELREYLGSAFEQANGPHTQPD